MKKLFAIMTAAALAVAGAGCAEDTDMALNNGAALADALLNGFGG